MHAQDCRAQLATAVGAEFAQLLEAVTADGKIEEAEVRNITEWLSRVKIERKHSGDN